MGCSTHRFVASQHPNGKPEVVIYMKGKGDDAEKVMEKVYYQNGQMEYVGHFENGVENGVWTYYYEDGTKKSQETWVNGVENGLFIDYDPSGQVYREITYENGARGEGGGPLAEVACRRQAGCTNSHRRTIRCPSRQQKHA
jgi:hypothetical protein